MQVVIRSPIPAKPAKVCDSAPWATPKRVISARPRVSRAALALSPKPRPSQMPAAMPITFLSAPANSTPTTSAFVYVRIRSEPTRERGGFAVVADAEPLADARRDADQVLERSRQFDADDVRVRVRPK